MRRSGSRIRGLEAVEERVDSLEKIFAQFLTRSEREARQHTLEMAQIAEHVGRFAEDIVAPNIPRLAREIFGITEVQFSAQRVEKRHVRDSARFREFDLILTGQSKLIVVETKATPRLKYIEDFGETLKDLCGSVKGPRDLSTNPKYMEEFGQ